MQVPCRAKCGAEYTHEHWIDKGVCMQVPCRAECGEGYTHEHWLEKGVRVHCASTVWTAERGTCMTTGTNGGTNSRSMKSGSLCNAV